VNSSVYHRLAYSSTSNIVPKAPRKEQRTFIQTPRTLAKKPMNIKLEFDVTRVSPLSTFEFDSTALELISSFVTSVVEVSFTEKEYSKMIEYYLMKMEELWKPKGRLKEQELRQLVVFSRSIETDPDRLRKLMEMAGEQLDYSCYIVWLTIPFDLLPEVYRKVELQLFRLAKNIEHVHITILDKSKHSNLVTDLMKELGIDSLPALIVSLEPIDLKEPKRENTVVIVKGEVFKWLDRHKKLQEFISNIPVWARIGVLEKKEREVRMEILLEKLLEFLKGIGIWDLVKSLVSTNIL